MIGCVGQRRAERMITRGQLLPPEDALNAGLVDELVPSAALHDVANARLLELLAIPGRAIAKACFRLCKLTAEEWSRSQLENAAASPSDLCRTLPRTMY